MAYAVRGRSSQVFAPSVYRGPLHRKAIALTFDDGPSPGSLRLLEYLGAENVRATFFQCGINVLRHTAIARQIYGAGHEIGNHTYSHPRLCLRSNEFVFGEFARAQLVLQGELGVHPALLRAPYGLRWFGMRETQRRLGMLGVMWTVIGRDWKWSSRAIADLVLRNAQPGGIVCLHDGRAIQPNPNIQETLDAVRIIVPRLRDAGYRFETVSELLR